MIPKGLTEAHFRRAVADIARHGVPPIRASRHYDLILDGRAYPPKYIVSLAYRFAHGQEWPASKFNAVEAKDFFLRRGYKIVDRRERLRQTVAPEGDESAFPEGKERYKQHRYLERDSSIVKKAKKKRLSEAGRLQCDVCKFDFEAMYGEIGRGFIEAHHLTPVSELDRETKTRIDDLGLVCSNCHRMLHRGPALLSIAELRRVVRG